MMICHESGVMGFSVMRRLQGSWDMHQGRWKRRWQTLPCGLHKDGMQIYSGSKDEGIFGMKLLSH